MNSEMSGRGAETVRIASAEAVSAWLADNASLTESLLTNLSLENHGYSVEIVLRRITDRVGRLLEEESDVVIRLDAVEELSLLGSLNAVMVENPDRINWGLSEVSTVTLAPEGNAYRLHIRWEDDRKIEVLSHRVSMEASDSGGDSK